eukprot:m.287725 g.287725  ORF g.287725 m.287725 type:complete len:465 (-) comp19952_c0_seq1:208-1602(-)
MSGDSRRSFREVRIPIEHRLSRRRSPVRMHHEVSHRGHQHSYQNRYQYQEDRRNDYHQRHERDFRVTHNTHHSRYREPYKRDRDEDWRYDKHGKKTKISVETHAADDLLRRSGGSKLYVTLFNELNSSIFNELMKQRGWHPISVDEALRRGTVSLLMVDGTYKWTRELYALKTEYKCRLQAEAFSNKVVLHRRLLDFGIADETIASTHVIDCSPSSECPVLPEEGVWIWRPEGGFSGDGVEVVTDQISLEVAWKNHSRVVKSGGGRGKHTKSLLSWYMVNPELLDGKKFHLRLYFLVVCTSREKRAAFFHEGEIAHAKKAYKPSDWGNKDIHDTHFTWSKDCRFPRDYPKGPEAAADVVKKARNIMTRVCECVMPHVDKYRECDVGFELFACDFMVDSTGKVILLEVNFKPGFWIDGPAGSQERVDWLSKFLLEGIVEFVFDRDPAHYTQLVQCFPSPRGKCLV